MKNDEQGLKSYGEVKDEPDPHMAERKAEITNLEALPPTDVRYDKPLHCAW